MTDAHAVLHVGTTTFQGTAEEIALYRDRLAAGHVDRLTAERDAALAQVAAWRAHIDPEMPTDFKDYWQNNEHAAVTAASLRMLRERVEIAEAQAAGTNPRDALSILDRYVNP